MQTSKTRSLELTVKLKYLPKNIGPLAYQTARHYFFLFPLCRAPNGR